MPTLSFGCFVPTAAEVQQLQMDLFPKYLAGRLGLDILPFKSTEMPNIQFRQPDNYRGLQPYRGLNKPTQHIPRRYNPWGTLCQIEPGYWGEHNDIDEEIMTKWGGSTCNTMLDLTEYTTMLQNELLERRANRIEYLIWQSLVFGRYTALNTSGQVVQEGEFNIQNTSSPIPWTNLAGSFPLRDFRQIQLLGRGTSTKFDTCAKAYMNRVTANALMSNVNPQDVGRVGLSACCTFMSLEQINQQFAAQGLPQLVIYDDGYLDDSGNFNLFIPDGYVVIVGCRPGNINIGHFWLTRNAVGCSVTSGFWQKLIDSCDKEVPRKVSIYDGFNGAPAIEYSKAVVVLRVF